MTEKAILKDSLDAVEKWDAESQTMDFVISDASVDRVGDVVDVDGWELKNFKKNPVVLFAHRYDQPAVGQATKVWTEDNKLRARVQFAPTALGQEMQSLYAGRFMRATSVGFMPLEQEERKVSEEEAAKYGFHMPTRYKRQELLEFSLVPVPANANALAAAITGGLQAKAFQEALAQAVTGESGEIATITVSGDATAEPLPISLEKDERPSRREMLDEFDYLHDLLEERGEFSSSEQAVAKALIGELWPRAYPEQGGRETGGDIPDDIKSEDYDAVTTALDLIYQAGDHLTTVIAKRGATQGDTAGAANETPVGDGSETDGFDGVPELAERLAQQIAQALAEKWEK